VPWLRDEPAVVQRLPPLNAIVDVDLARREGWNPLDLASAFLDGGARFLQLRAKHAASGELLDLASAVVERVHAAGGLLVVNDRADIARLAGADGVHVGQDDLAPAAVRLVTGDLALVGLSTQTEAQIDAALAVRDGLPSQPIDYLAVGPVFRTTTKATGGDAVGLERVRYAAARAGAQGVPVVAIGGITLDLAPAVIAAGATSVAVIGDLLATGDPEKRVRAFVERLAGKGNV
jgi:thiamine-phosphate pyrophosphorylase